MSTAGYCVDCGASMWRDGDGKLHARNPAPGCQCSLPPQAVFTIDRPADSEIWYAWRGDQWSGDVIATGSLSRVLQAVEEAAA